MVNLSILSLNQKFLPDYLLEKQEVLKELDGLNEDERTIYGSDISTLNRLLRNQNFEIDKDEKYKLRVEMLLE